MKLFYESTGGGVKWKENEKGSTREMEEYFLFMYTLCR